MIRDFIVETEYEQQDLPKGNAVTRVVRGECGRVCSRLRFGLPEGDTRCPNLVRVEWAADQRRAIRTADMRNYVRVVCAETDEEKVALELMGD